MSLRRWALRAVEATALLRYAASPVSAGRLLGAYAATARDPRSSRPTRLALRVAGRRMVVNMRASDVYTLAEVLHEGQYDIARRLPSAPVVVDAGANIGVTALWFLALRPQARILAFEPEAANFGLLERNLRPFPGAAPTRAALGSRTGTIELFVADHGALHTTRSELGGAGRRERTPLLRLDGVLDEAGVERVDLVKLDVEGAELEVLEGLGSWAGRVDRIAGEVHEEVVSVEELGSWLESHGFALGALTVPPSAAGKGVRCFEARSGS